MHVKPLEEYLKKLTAIIVIITITNIITLLDRMTILSRVKHRHAAQSHMLRSAFPKEIPNSLLCSPRTVDFFLLHLLMRCSSKRPLQ